MNAGDSRKVKNLVSYFSNLKQMDWWPQLSLLRLLDLDFSLEAIGYHKLTARTVRTRRPRAQMFTVVPQKRSGFIQLWLNLTECYCQTCLVPDPQGGHHKLGQDRSPAVRGQEVRPLSQSDEDHGEEVRVAEHQEEVRLQSGKQAQEVHGLHDQSPPHGQTLLRLQGQDPPPEHHHQQCQRQGRLSQFQ